MTFRSSTIYWSMHITMAGAAVWLWITLVAGAPEMSIRVILAGLFSTVQMGFLGALITFLPRAMYTPHFLTTAAWGLTPLQDQQLGGVVMWVPGCIIFLAAATMVMWNVLKPSGLQPGFEQLISDRQPRTLPAETVVLAG